MTKGWAPDEKLRKAAQENADKISGSDCFVVLFNDKMIEEVVPLIQMGCAVYMD